MQKYDWLPWCTREDVVLSIVHMLVFLKDMLPPGTSLTNNLTSNNSN